MKTLFFAGFKKGMRLFGEGIATLVNTTLLFAVYVIGVGLTSLFARLSGKRFLETGRKKSYWSELDLKKKPLESYYRQF